MQSMSTIRKWHIMQLQWSMQTLRFMIGGIDPDTATLYRDGGDGWTVTEVMGHLNDFEAIFFERARLTHEQDFPALPFPDPDELAQRNNYQLHPVQELLASWLQRRTEHIAYLESIEGDEAWERPGNHPKRGSFTLNDQLFLTAWHDMLHMDQIIKIVEQKQVNA